MKSQLIVLGATGCIGRRAVAAALEAGRGVVAVARDGAELQALRSAHADYGKALTTLDASVSSDVAAADLAARIRATGLPVDGVIAAIGGDTVRGRLLDQPAEFLRHRLDEDLLPHLFAARHLLPLLAESQRGGYVLIGGPGADQPWAGYGHRSIGAAALRMLARVLHDEARACAVRVQLLAVDSPARTDSNARHACSQWPSADAIAHHAVAMTAGAEPPQHAIVRFADGASAARGVRATPTTLWSDNLEGAASDVPKPTIARAPVDSGAPRSSSDVNALLRAIASSPRLQETSPP